MPSIRQHLPETPRAKLLSTEQIEKLDAYGGMLRDFNRKINLISRDDATAIERVHIPHTLALTVRDFPAGAVVTDWGTGGGLPAIPLAIACPELTVYAVDVVEKKVLAVRTMARRLGLENVHAWNGEAERFVGQASHSVSRATAPLADLWRWHRRIGEIGGGNAGAWLPGLVCLKGGDLSKEIAELKQDSERDSGSVPHVEVIPLQPYYADAYFESKCLVHVFENAPNP